MANRLFRILSIVVSLAVLAALTTPLASADTVVTFTLCGITDSKLTVTGWFTLDETSQTQALADQPNLAGALLNWNITEIANAPSFTGTFIYTPLDSIDLNQGSDDNMLVLSSSSPYHDLYLIPVNPFTDVIDPNYAAMDNVLSNNNPGGGGVFGSYVPVIATSEPSSLSLLVIGLAGLLGFQLRKRFIA
jgi:hypothetical protein